MKHLLIAACALALAGPAAAQDYNAEPNYGSITLAPGFQPDPYLVSLRAGGSISASNAGSGCAASSPMRPTSASSGTATAR